MAESTAPLLDPLLERYLSELRIEGGLAINTLESYRRDLFRLQRYLKQHQLSIKDSIPPHMIRSFIASHTQEAIAP
jgi:integrase/recombinase XerD